MLFIYGDDFMKNIWRLSEILAERRIQKYGIKNENYLKVKTEKLFLTINMVLWFVIGLIISFIICRVYLSGILNNLNIVFMITGYFTAIMFLVGFLCMCRQSSDG